MGAETLFITSSSYRNIVQHGLNTRWDCGEPSVTRKGVATPKLEHQGSCDVIVRQNWAGYISHEMMIDFL